MVRLITLILIVCFLLGFFLSSPIFQVEEVNIEGYDPDSINLDHMLGDNIITLEHSSFLNENLKENPYIDRVNIQRDFPDRVILTVEYNKPEAAVIIDENYTVFNQYNYIIAENLETNEFNVPVFKGLPYRFRGREIIFPQKGNNILRNLESLNSEILDLVNHIEFQERLIRIELENDCFIKLGTQEEITRKFIILNSLWQQIGNNFDHLKYIDLSTPERPVIKEK